MRTKIIFVILIILSFIVLIDYPVIAATNSAQPEINASLLEPSATLRFDDIPVPVGFKLLPKESYAFESSGVKVGILKYQGKANPDQVVNFYKEQMAMYNWDLLNIIEYNERVLNFERENQTCIVNILPKGKTAYITISFGPKTVKAPKKAKAPIK